LLVIGVEHKGTACFGIEGKRRQDAICASTIGGGEVRVADVEECSPGRRLDADTRDGGYEDVELAEAGEERVEAGRFEG
jgi:hypothetical protein